MVQGPIPANILTLQALSPPKEATRHLVLVKGRKLLGLIALLIVASTTIPAAATPVAFRYSGPGCALNCSLYGMHAGVPLNGVLVFDDSKLSPGAALTGSNLLGFSLSAGNIHINQRSAAAYSRGFIGSLNTTANAFQNYFAFVASTAISPQSGNFAFLSSGAFASTPQPPWLMGPGACNDPSCQSGFSGPDAGVLGGTATLTRIPGAFSPSFAQRVSNSWLPPFVQGNLILDTFRPDLTGLNCPGLSALTCLAQSAGFDHFNIEQDITSIFDHGILPVFRGTGVDPALGGNPGSNVADNFPWYWDEVPTNASGSTYLDPNITLPDRFRWEDAPDLGLLRAGDQFTFTDYLVGVYPDHTGVRISDLFPDALNVNFTWTFTQGLWGGSSVDENILALNDLYPSQPGSEGSVKFLGYFDTDPEKLSPVSATVPEPSTLAVFGAGLLGFGAVRRRRKAKT